MARVTQIALEVMARPWRWGEADCCTSACDVFNILHGLDPMAEYRGRYDSQASALRIIARHGGMIGLVETLAERVGLVACAPRAGAIGATDKSLLVCVRPGLWLGKTLHGLTSLGDPEVAYHVAD